MKSITKLLATSCLATMLAGTAHAQVVPVEALPDTNTATTDNDDDAIVVTGTRIRRPNATSAAPIQSVTSEEIRLQAAVNVEDVLNRLPQIAPDAQQNYQDSDGRQRIKLRSLGFERTLTLVDGLRLGTQNGVDAGMIPVALIERIDVLSGGASSVYGSDAVAGVVNFILRKDLDGINLNANYNFYNHENKDTLVSPYARAAGFPVPRGLTNDGARVDLTLSAGTKLFDDRLSVMGFVNYRKADLVPYDARASSACQLVEAGIDGPLSCSTSTYTQYGYLSPRGGTQANRVYANNPDGTRTFVPFGVGIQANPFDGYSYQRESNRLNAGGFVSLKLSDAVELYGNGLWFKDKSYNRFPARVFSFTAYGSTPFSVNCNNPLMSTAQQAAICGTAAGTSTLLPIEVRYRFNALPYSADLYENQGIRAVGGVRGTIAEAWSYDVAGVYVRSQQDVTNGPFPEFAKINRSLNVVNVGGTPTCATGTADGCVPFDAFTANNNNTALYDYLFSGRDGTYGNVTQLFDVVANLSGDLGKYGITAPWADQGVAFAIGAEYRKDRFLGTANQVYREQIGGENFQLRQSVKEANVEVQVPLVEKQRWTHLLQVNAGYRLSKYDTNPDTFSTYKIEALWAPIQDVTFRGAFNKAQRAPTVIEIRQATQRQYGTQGGSQNDFCASTTIQVPDPTDPTRTITQTVAPRASIDVCRATGLADSLYGSPTLNCPNNQCTVFTGGFTVDPETAWTKTFGVVLKPRFLPGLTFSVDRFLIDIDDSIGYADYSYWQEGCLTSGGDSYFCDKIVRAPTTGILYSAPATNPTSGYIQQGTTNTYKTKAHGWDFQGQYVLPIDRFGTLDWIFNGSWTTLAGNQESPIRDERNCTGLFGNGCGQLIPKWTHGLRTTYITPDKVASISFNWRYVGSLTHAKNSGDSAVGGTPEDARKTFYRFDPVSYFDLAATFAVGKQFTLRFAANNLLDKVPPILPNSYDVSLARNNTIPARYDSLGRQISIGATVNF
ncbi:MULTISPECIES: TonB-dependent receptor domain-containing protein [unclassified Sphingomonas]|uniref:TonB-dependent receptor domain-containing protein n=1 Tax=unclassified Sphingomonas TaxID=196159 RepID=UPI0009EC421E|nr:MULTISPECIES: TonB-dependent receptor [unclassified Sphingomonas]